MAMKMFIRHHISSLNGGSHFERAVSRVYSFKISGAFLNLWLCLNLKVYWELHIAELIEAAFFLKIEHYRELVSEFPALYGPQSFITVFTTASYLNQVNLVYILEPCLPRIRVNIIFLCTPESSEWTVQDFSQNYVLICHLPHACYIPWPSHYWHNYSGNI